MDKNPIRGETYVSIALLALMLVSIGFLVVRGIVIAQVQQSLAAAEGASAASTPSKKDTLTPQCAAATKNNEKLAQYGVRPEIIKQMPVEYDKSIKEATKEGFCESEYKVQQHWKGCDSKKCPMGVNVFPPGTKLSSGVVQCSTDSKGFVVACRSNPDAEQPSKQDTGTQPGKSTEQLAKDAAKTDAGQGGGQGGGSGGGSGSGQTPSNEALDKVFGEDKPAAAQATEKAEQSKELAKEIAAVQEEYNKAVNQGASQQKINDLAGEIELLKNERAQLAPYERDELLASKQALDANPSADWATQRSSIDSQISSLDKLIDDYGAQGAGQNGRPPLGGPYANPNLVDNTMFYDAPKPDTRTPTLYANDGSAMGGGEQAAFRGPDGTSDLNGHTLEDYLSCTASGATGCYVATAGPLSCGGCIRTTLDPFYFKGSDGEWKTLPTGSTLVQYDSGALKTGLDMIPYQGARDSTLEGTYGTGTLDVSGPSTMGGTLKTQIVGIYTPTQQQALRRLRQISGR